MVSNRNNGAKLGFENQLWKAADKLRNNLDAAEYKHVVLGLIFLKYISDAKPLPNSLTSLSVGSQRPILAISGIRPASDNLESKCQRVVSNISRGLHKESSDKRMDSHTHDSQCPGNGKG